LDESTGKCLVVLTALRFSEDYGAAALRSAKERREGVVLCLVVDREISNAVASQLADVGFLGEKLLQNLRETMIGEYRTRGLGHLRDLEEQARGLGLAVETVVADGPFLDAVVNVARQHDVDRIVVARTDRPHLSRLFFGSEIDRLLKRAPCPVEVFDVSGTPVPFGRR